MPAKKRKKDPAAVAMGRKGGQARQRNLSKEELSAIGKAGANARYGRTKPSPPPTRWYGLFALETPAPELILYSHDKADLRQRGAKGDHVFLIEPLDYDPRTRIPITAKYEPDTSANLRALDDLQRLGTDEEKGGRP